MEKVYIFDMGRVIKSGYDYESFYKELNPNIPYEKFSELYMEDTELTQTGKMSDEEFFTRLIKKINLDIDEKSMEEIYLKHTTGIYSSTCKIINKLKSMGKKIYLLSDLKRIDFKNLNNIFDVSKFEKMYLSYETGYMKNSTKVFELVVNDLNMNPSNILFFDDNLRNVENAKKVGIDAYQVTGETIEELFEKYDLFNK